MIDKSMIKRLAEQCGIDITHENLAEFQAFANACYAAGQDAQRESNAKICLQLGRTQTGTDYIEIADAIRANK